MKWKTRFIVIISLSILSCNKTPVSDIPTPAIQGMFKPYEINFVTKVMHDAGMLMNGVKLNPTHKYVSFQASTEEALLYLVNSGLMITPFSLADGLRVENGLFYSMIPADQVVDPLVKINILAELYIPGPDEKKLDNLLLRESGYLDKHEPTPLYRTTGAIIKGKITLEYPENGSYRPLRNVSLVAVENARIVSGKTDETGTFSFSGNFSKKVDIYAVFDNETVQINRLPKRNLLETFFPAWQKLGTYKNDTWGNISIEIPFSNPEPWSLSTLNNSVFEYYDFCDAFGYKKPNKKLVMWADENYLLSSSYAAPMLNHLAQNDRRNIADILQNMLGIPRSVSLPLSNLVNVGVPDIYTHYFSSQPTRRLRKVMFHELTHAAHFMQIGDQFWVKYISYIVKNGGYGLETTPGNGIVAYAEGWADDLSYECYKYNFDSYLEVNPENVPLEWIVYGLFYDLWDNNNDGGTDKVSGISFRAIYDLFTPEVDNPVTLKEKIKSHIAGPGASMEDIEVLFNRHGY